LKRALDRDVSTPSPYPGVFAFKLDFGGTLRCIPMSVRLKLDQTGIRLSLKQWNKLPASKWCRTQGDVRVREATASVERGRLGQADGHELSSGNSHLSERVLLGVSIPL